MLRNWDLPFWTPVNFEVEYFINEETEGVLTDTVIYFSDQHQLGYLNSNLMLRWVSQVTNVSSGTYRTTRRTYLVGKVKALCLPDAVYDLIIGQVPGARAPDAYSRTLLHEWYQASPAVAASQSETRLPL